MDLTNVIGDFLKISSNLLHDEETLLNLKIDAIDIFETLCELEIQFQKSIQYEYNCNTVGDFIKTVSRSI